MRPRESGIKVLMHIGQAYYESGQPKQWKGQELGDETGLNIGEINDGVSFLKENDLVKDIMFKNAPYTFGYVVITTDGKEVYNDIVESANTQRRPIGF